MYKNLFQKKHNNVLNIDFQKKKILKIKYYIIHKKILKFFLKKKYIKNIEVHQTRIISICKVTGTLKKTNKRANVTRHICRKYQNTKYLRLWQIANW